MTAPQSLSERLRYSETREVYDPFLSKTVEVSNKLTDRLRGKYANGPTMPNGEPEFGWREFQTPPIQHEAAHAIDAKDEEIKKLRREIFDLTCEMKEAHDRTD